MVGKAWQSKKFRPAVRFAEVDVDRNRGASLADIAQEQERRRSSVAAPTNGKDNYVQQGEKTYENA